MKRLGVPGLEPSCFEYIHTTELALPQSLYLLLNLIHTRVISKAPSLDQTALS